jgi:hypothetical protein
MKKSLQLRRFSKSSSTTPIGLRIDGQAVQSPQGPDGLPLVGSFYEIFPDHLGNHYRLFQKYGHVIKTTNMGKITYLTDSPEVAAVSLAESAYMTKRSTRIILFGA